MLEFLKRRLANEEGAMDKILVTLLLVVVGVAAVVGLTSWLNTQSDSVQTEAGNQVTSVITEAQNAAN